MQATCVGVFFHVCLNNASQPNQWKHLNLKCTSLDKTIGQLYSPQERECSNNLSMDQAGCGVFIPTHG